MNTYILSLNRPSYYSPGWLESDLWPSSSLSLQSTNFSHLAKVERILSPTLEIYSRPSLNLLLGENDFEL